MKTKFEQQQRKWEYSEESKEVESKEVESKKLTYKRIRPKILPWKVGDKILVNDQVRLQCEKIAPKRVTFKILPA